MKTIRFIAVIVSCGLKAAIPVFPCTTFVLQGGAPIYFGRNLDWHWETGWVIVNQRNVNKTALVAPDRSPAKWTSKYGSITFNQFGQEQPYGGMNEPGLVIEQMQLIESAYPATGSRPEIGQLQWMQFQLDTCATVAEVVATDSKIRPQSIVATKEGRVHYLVADAAGDSATIEWLDGKMICHRGASLPSHALANDTYAQSVVFARTNPAPVTVTEPLKDPSSLARFACAASRAAGFQSRNSEADLAYAFETLDQVRQGEFTVWQIVYEITARRIHYRTLSNPRTRTLDLDTLNFDCAGAVKFADITASPSSSGSIDLQDLSEGWHRQYLQEFLSRESLKKVLGDLTPMLESLLLSVRNNGCATAPRSPAQGSKCSSPLR